MDPVERLSQALSGRYEIERELGRGGMATVYLAKDLKHERPVAVKVLKPELVAALGPERFLNEIRVTANLSHPRILPLFDSGEADGLLFYVMPVVEGESLRERLAREKQLGVEESVRIASGVAHALDHAHRHGVVHRDIKPANILFQDGEVLVADFGIALAVTLAGDERMTETGLSLGTIEYMSPEQAAGDRTADGRSDVYSLGVVLYEMLAGRPPFMGGNLQEVLARMLSDNPRPVTDLRSTVPVNVAMALEKALSRVPADRFSTPAEFADALANPAFRLPESQSAAVGSVPASSASRLGRWAPWAVAVAAVGFALLRGPAGSEPPHTKRLEIELPGQVGPIDSRLAIAPDGNSLVFLHADGGLHLRRLDALESRAIEGTSGAFAPAFSPDGSAIAFVADGLRTASLEGGPSRLLTDSVWSRPSWGDDGYVYFVHLDMSVARVPADGGPVEHLTTPDFSQESQHVSPRKVPGSSGVIYTVYRWPNFRSDVAVVDLETREARLLLQGSQGRYASTGHLVYVQGDGTLMAVPFDEQSLELAGTPTPMEGPLVGDQFALGLDGTLVFRSAGERGIVLLDRSGRRRVLSRQVRVGLHPRVSPDGSRIVLGMPGDVGMDIWSFSLLDSALTRLTFEGDDIYPSWSADGRSVLFARTPTRGGSDWRFYSMPADGTGQPQRLLDVEDVQVEVVAMPDGSGLVYRAGDVGRGQGATIRYVSADGREPRDVVDTRADDWAPAISPDGRWLAYQTDRGDGINVYVRPLSGEGGDVRISRDAVSFGPVWARDGSEVFYVSGAALWAVQLETEPSLRVVSRLRIATVDMFEPYGLSHASFDVLPGDEEFVFIGPTGESSRLVMVLDWFEDLRRRAPHPRAMMGSAPER